MEEKENSSWKNQVYTVKLSNSEHFVSIQDETRNYYGGNQSWFLKDVAKKGACGTVAVANIVAYMASVQEKYKCLYKYNDFSIDNFHNCMDDIYKYLYPYKIPFTTVPLGIWPISKLERRTKKFAADQGLKLQSFSLGPRAGKWQITKYLIEALKNDLPVAMLVGYNSKLNQIRVTLPDNRYFIQPSMKLHWVTVTETHIDNNTKKVILKVSTWGGYAYLDMDDYIQGEKIYRGFVYFK